MQLGFWAFIMLFVPLTIVRARYELRTFGYPGRYLWMVAILAFADSVRLTSNRLRSKEAVLYIKFRILAHVFLARASPRSHDSTPMVRTSLSSCLPQRGTIQHFRRK